MSEELTDRELIDILFKELKRLGDVVEHALVDHDQRLQSIELRMRKLERAQRITPEEALATFDALKRLNPSLTLQAYADDYGLKYDTLKKARMRLRRKARGDLST